MALRPVPIDENSPFLEEACALCKEGFQVGDEIVVCPDDATRHHLACWQANGNKCTAYGCKGAGVVGKVEILPPVSPRARVVGNQTVPSSQQTRSPARSKVRVMPALNLSCRTGCFLLLVLLTIVVGVSCGLAMWAVYYWIQTGGVTGFVPALLHTILL